MSSTPGPTPETTPRCALWKASGRRLADPPMETETVSGSVALYHATSLIVTRPFFAFTSTAESSRTTTPLESIAYHLPSIL